jgi:RES domain-containing protein
VLTGWRVADPEFSVTPEMMMSGEGAFLYGGRWNSKGTRIVYLGSSLAQSAMELLVHLDRPKVLMAFNKMSVSFEESLVQHIPLKDLPGNWSEPSMASSVQDVGDLWAKEQGSLILHVPSAVIPGEYNYLFNPIHPDVSKAKMSNIISFNFDPRVLKP